MAACRGGIICGGVAFPGRYIACDFVCALPFPAGGDILALNRAGDANRLDDVGPPFRQIQQAACLEHLDLALFLAVTPYFAGLHVAILRLVPDRESLEPPFEGWAGAPDPGAAPRARPPHPLHGL